MSLERVLDRLVASGAVLGAVAAVFLVLLGLGRLGLPDALAGFGVVLLAAALLPLRPASTRNSSNGAADPLSETTVRRTADALPDPCMILDQRAVVLHRNAAAIQQFSGVTEGRPLSLSLRFPPLLAAVEAVRSGGPAHTVELHQTVPTETWHRVTVAPLGHGGPDRLLIVMLQSLTEEKRLDALRTDFVANASHELRTPLASLLGFIDTLLGPAADDAAARAKFLGIMQAQAMRMSRLIDDLLSLSRIEMHQHVRPTTRLDLGILLREVCEGLQTQAVQAGVAIRLDLPADSAAVTGERNELYEVFENLIDNAIKYGSDGGTVEVVLAPAGEDRVAASITDHGAGIESVHVPRLTERFYRVDAESSRRKRGTGLGLAIVKHIVTRHRGTLTIRSRPGEGTRVEVLLPR